MPNAKNVIVYRTATGKEPITEWLSSQRQDILQAQAYWQEYQTHE
jgi:hypothetical protein